jgi:threonyl-tRNA synthetase
MESARAFTEELRAAGIRAELDERSETLNYRIREAETLKVPYMAVIGGREAEAGTVAVRVRGTGKKQVIVSREAFTSHLREQAVSRTLEVGLPG